MVFSGVAVLVGALLVGLVVLMSRGDEDDAAPPSTSLAVSTTATAPPTTVAPTPAELLAAMPAGPLDGRDSWRLPVLVTPQSGVVDGGSSPHSAAASSRASASVS